MSTAVSSISAAHDPQAYFQQRRADLSQLGQALLSGDLAGAQNAFAALQALARQHSPFSHSDVFQYRQRAQDFAAVGQALQAGDLYAANQSFGQLEGTFGFNPRVPVGARPGPVTINLAPPAAANGTGSPASSSGASASSGPELILNLGSGSVNGTPEQITLNLNNTPNGAEQLTISVANQQGGNAEQITVNFAQNSNEQIILNLFNSSTAAPSTGNAVNQVA